MALGAKHSIAEIAGQRALRLEHADGATQMTVLSEDELGMFFEHLRGEDEAS